MSPDDPIAELLGTSRADAFAPGFADRVARRVAADRRARGSVATVLPGQFRRIVPALVAASLALAVANWWSGRDAAGLPRVTLADALTVGDTSGSLP